MYTVNQDCMSLSSFYLDYSCHVARLVVVVRMCPQAIPLAIPQAMITMRKSTHGFPFASHMGKGLRLVALWAAGALLSQILLFWNYGVKYIFFWFYRSVGFEGNILLKKGIKSAVACADETVFHFPYVTNESDGTIIIK